jgi:hypothetical protein
MKRGRTAFISFPPSFLRYCFAKEENVFYFSELLYGEQFPVFINFAKILKKYTLLNGGLPLPLW